MFARFLSWLASRWNGRSSDASSAVAATVSEPGKMDEVVAGVGETAPAPVSDGARHLMLAARLASVAKLNTKAGNQQRRRASGSLSAMPVSRIGAKKERRGAGDRRVISVAARRSAQIIAFPVPRRANAGHIPARKAA